MLRYTIERLAIGFMTLIVIISITFFLLQLMPGSPFNDDKLSTEQLALMNQKYGLDEPLIIQYKNYMVRIFHGDFGNSFKYDNQKVSTLIGKKLVYTTQIGMMALTFGVIVGILLGALAAIKRKSILDYLTVVVAIIGVSIPSFVLGPLMQFLFGVKLAWVPVIYEKTLYSSLLPAFALSLFVIASTAIFMRTELVEVLNTDYILLARAKGLSSIQVIFKHALRNALIPVITIVGPIAITLLTGSLVIENIFGVPGVGSMLVDGINRKDYFIILGVASFYSILYILILIITDLFYGVIDPRIRVSGGKS